MPSTSDGTDDKSRPLKSLVTKRAVVISGHKTSVSLERPFWDALREIAAVSGIRLQDLVTKIDQGRVHNNLSSAIRVFVLGTYRTKDRNIKG